MKQGCWVDDLSRGARFKTLNFKMANGMQIKKLTSVPHQWLANDDVKLIFWSAVV